MAAERLEKAKGQAKAVSYIFFILCVPMVFIVGSCVTSVGSSLDRLGQAETIMSTHTLAEPTMPIVYLAAQQHIYHQLHEKIRTSLVNTGMGLLGFGLYSCQLVGATRLYMGTQKGVTPTLALPLVLNHQHTQIIFLGIDLYFSVWTATLIYGIGVMEPLIAYLFVILLFILTCPLLFRGILFYIVHQFHKELRSSVENGAGSAENI